MTRLLTITVAFGLFAAACGSQTPTGPTTTAPTPVTTMFAGTLSRNGTQFQSFAIGESGTAAVTLVSLVTAAGEVVDTAVTLAIGNASAGTCSTTSAASASPALKAHLSPSLTAGNYCVRISDAGQLAEPLAFVVRIVSFPVTTNATSTDTNAIDSVVTNLPVGGFATRTFTASKNGTINITLSSVTPIAEVGIGIGVDAGNGTCRLAQFVAREPGSEPQLSLPADAGDYCMKLVDIGNLAALTRGVVPFTMLISHP